MSPHHLLHVQAAATFLLSSWAVLLVALLPPVWGRLMAMAQPRWHLGEVRYYHLQTR